MGSVARGSPARRLLVVACAAIAGIDAPGADRAAPGDRTSPRTRPATIRATSRRGARARRGSWTRRARRPASADGGAEASLPPTPACPPPQKPDGEPCQSASECCSEACREDLRCAPACKADGERCGFNSNDECCAGLWCGGTARTQCIACIPKGNPAAKVVGVAVERSCCSRSANVFNGLCD
ncbi:MAG: hypothetical protein KIS78_06450 [Labilithrix sp.]|nr:hypothetical protein [Labilithrix sp.]